MLSGAIADRLKEVGINRITAPVRLYFVRSSVFLRKHAQSKYVLYSCENARQVSVFSAPFTLDKKRQTEVRRTFNGKFFDLYICMTKSGENLHTFFTFFEK